MSIQIRKAKITDCDAVYNLITLLENKILQKDFFYKKFKMHINANHIIYLVAISKQFGIIGFLSCHLQHLLHHDLSVGEIQELYIIRKYRKLGIGSQLINVLQKELQNVKIESLEVTAQNKRTIAHLFYKKVGFKQTHIKFTKAIM